MDAVCGALPSAAVGQSGLRLDPGWDSFGADLSGSMMGYLSRRA